MLKKVSSGDKRHIMNVLCNNSKLYSALLFHRIAIVSLSSFNCELRANCFCYLDALSV